MQRESYNSARVVGLAAVCLALNVGLAKTSNLLSLPFTFDTVGTILAAALLPWRFALGVALLSSVFGSIIIHPAFIYYAGTQAAISIAAILSVRSGCFSRMWTALLTGLAIGVLSAIVSSPVTALVWGGVSVPSITALNVLFMASGKSLWASVISGSLIVESVDKAVAGVLVWALLRRIGSMSTPPDAVAAFSDVDSDSL